MEESKAQSTEASSWLDSKTAMIKCILLYNVRNILDIQQRLSVSNALQINSQYDIVCFTETWLTNDIPDSVLFLGDYIIHRQNKTSKNSSATNDGCVLIAVKPEISHDRMELKILIEKAFVLKYKEDAKASLCLVCIALQNQPKTKRLSSYCKTTSPN